VIIEVLIAERDSVNALSQQIDLRVADELGCARGSAIHLPQYHHPAVTGDIAPGNWPRFCADQSLEK
jgi:hypothetical protein